MAAAKARAAAAKQRADAKDARNKVASDSEDEGPAIVLATPLAAGVKETGSSATGGGEGRDTAKKGGGSMDMDGGKDKDKDKGKDVAAVLKEGGKESEGKRAGGRERRRSGSREKRSDRRSRSKDRCA